MCGCEDVTMPRGTGAQRGPKPRLCVPGEPRPHGLTSWAMGSECDAE